MESNVSNENNDYSIFTDVKVGKSFKNRGWHLKKQDFNELIPISNYEGNCDIEIDNIRVPARIIMDLTLFYSDKTVSKHLEELYHINPNKEIKIEIKTNKKNLYSNFIPQLNNTEKLEVIKLKLPIKNSFINQNCFLNQDFISQIFPLNQIPKEYEIIVDGIKTKGMLNIGFRLFYKDKELANHLQQLYELSPNLSISVSIFLNEQLTFYSTEKMGKGFFFYFDGRGLKKYNDKHNTSNFQVYEGKDPYIFISYKHADKNLISPLVKRLYDEGLNIWCDNGLEYGTDYDDIIDHKIANCSLFVIFITKRVIEKASDRNEYMKKELDVANATNKKILPIFLDDVQLIGKYRIHLTGKHSLSKSNYKDDEEFFKTCIETLKRYN